MTLQELATELKKIISIIEEPYPVNVGVFFNFMDKTVPKGEQVQRVKLFSDFLQKNEIEESLKRLVILEEYPEIDRLADGIKKLCHEKGLTQRVVAKECFVNVCWLSKVRRGLKPPTYDFIKKLQNLLGVKDKSLENLYREVIGNRGEVYFREWEEVFPDGMETENV